MHFTGIQAFADAFQIRPGKFGKDGFGLGMPSKKATQPGTSPPSFSLAILLLKLKQRHFLVDVSVLVLSFPECMASKKGK